MPDQELKKCPFCGGNAAFHETESGNYKNSRNYHFVYCTNEKCPVEMCMGADSWTATQKEAAELWNRRA